MIKRSVTIAGHRTSISLEEPFWNGLQELAARRKIPLAQLIGEIDKTCKGANLSSAARLYILEYYRNSALK